MPRVHRRGKYRQGIDLAAVLELLGGHWWDFLATAPRPTDAERQALWQTIGAELTALHVESFPGTRPAAWWAYDAPALPAPFAYDESTTKDQAAWLAAAGFLSSAERRALHEQPRATEGREDAEHGPPVLALAVIETWLERGIDPGAV